MSKDKQTRRETKRRARYYTDKYEIDPRIMNRYSSWITNPTVQPDERTEMGVPIPSELNTEFSKEYQEENKL